MGKAGHVNVIQQAVLYFTLELGASVEITYDSYGPHSIPESVFGKVRPHDRLACGDEGVPTGARQNRGDSRSEASPVEANLNE